MGDHDVLLRPGFSADGSWRFLSKEDPNGPKNSMDVGIAPVTADLWFRGLGRRLWSNFDSQMAGLISLTPAVQIRGGDNTELVGRLRVDVGLASTNRADALMPVRHLAAYGVYDQSRQGRENWGVGLESVAANPLTWLAATNMPVSIEYNQGIADNRERAIIVSMRMVGDWGRLVEAW